MKEKIYNPASTNEQSPAEGMGAVNTFNPEEVEDMKGHEHDPSPKILKGKSAGANVMILRKQRTRGSKRGNRKLKW